MKPKRETLKHTQAFEFYFGLGDRRSLPIVAEQFGVSQTSAQNWSAKFKWQDRIREREQQISAIIADRNKQASADMNERVLALCKAVMVIFARLLQADKVKVSPDDFVRVAQLEMLVRGAPTSREEKIIRGKSEDTRATAEFILSTVKETERNRPFLEYLRREVGSIAARIEPEPPGPGLPS